MGLSPDYAMLSVAATRDPSSSLLGEEGEGDVQRLEHLDIALALGVPLFAVVTKVRCKVKAEEGGGKREKGG